jgi:Ca2+-binding EF-hand superfamily protein
MGACVAREDRDRPHHDSHDSLNKPTIEEQKLKALRDLFHENDANHDGYLDQNDLVSMFRRHKEKTGACSDHGITEVEYAITFMVKADKDGDQLISEEEFLNFYQHK